MSFQGLLTHFKTLGVQQVQMTGGIYCTEFEAMKTLRIMWRRVSYMNNGETGDNRRSVARVFAEKQTFGKMFWKDL